MTDNKHKTSWRQISDGSWQYMVPIAVIGTVYKDTIGEDYWIWNARIMCDCTIPFGAPSLRGKARSLEGAKRIVEVLCEETGTILENTT